MSFEQRFARVNEAYLIPLIFELLIAPAIIFMFQMPDGDYIAQTFLQELLPPVALLWPVFFSYEDMAARGNELLYIKGRMKIGYYLFSVVVYMLFALPVHLLMIPMCKNLDWKMEYTRLFICSMFLVSMFYMLNYVFAKYALSVILCSAYVVYSYFLQAKTGKWQLLDERNATLSLIKDRYLVFLAAAVIMFAVGAVFNKKYEKYIV